MGKLYKDQPTSTARCSVARQAFTSSSRRKSRKAHFSAPSSVRRIIMSAPLSKELRAKYNVRSLPIREKDEVRIMVGQHKNREGKVKTVYRKRWVIHVDKCVVHKKKGTTPSIPIQPSNVEIIKVYRDKSRTKMLERKNRANLVNTEKAA